jgi:LuxR family transcriptional regulator, maltose regulon positive regulatory protein
LVWVSGRRSRLSPVDLGGLARHRRHCAWPDIRRYVAPARAYLPSAEQRFDDAISTLRGLQRELEGVPNLFFALRVETTLAIVRFRARQIAAALGSFDGIVAKFAPSGFYHTILDQGAETGPVLAAFGERAERTRSSPKRTSYLSNLTAGWRVALSIRAPAGPAVRDRGVAKCTRRRKLIAEGQSNKELGT